MVDLAALRPRGRARARPILRRSALRRALCARDRSPAGNTEDPVPGPCSSSASPAPGAGRPALHPRTRAAAARDGPRAGAGCPWPPLGFLDCIACSRRRRASPIRAAAEGGYLHRVPCVTLRDTTEWVETIQPGWNSSSSDPRGDRRAAAAPPRGATHPEVYGDGHAAGRTARLVTETAWRTGHAACNRERRHRCDRGRLRRVAASVAFAEAGEAVSASSPTPRASHDQRGRHLHQGRSLGEVVGARPAGLCAPRSTMPRWGPATT